MKALKKGAGAIGGFFKKGWGAVKSGASKANEKFKETEVLFMEMIDIQFGKKTVAEMDKFKQTEFAQKVAEGAKKTGAAVKEGARKTGAAMKEGAQKVRDSDFGQKVAEGAKKTGAAMKEGAQKAKVNMEKLGRDIKASMESQPGQSGYNNAPEEP